MGDGVRSREQLMAAATAEFAEHGIAGARVDRIAARAGVNKAQMYGWFGTKTDLFEAVFAEHLRAIVDTVPFTPYDLPGYAVNLYNSYLASPELVRLASWNRLERVPAGDLLVAHPGLTEDKFAAIEQAQRDGCIVEDVRPEDVYSLIIALAGTWSPVSATFTASTADSETDHERRRATLRAVVARALVPST